MDDTATPEAPIYRKIKHEERSETAHWFIVCDEGWRTSIVCERMYEWSADWLLSILKRQPYASNRQKERNA